MQYLPDYHNVRNGFIKVDDLKGIKESIKSGNDINCYYLTEHFPIHQLEQLNKMAIESKIDNQLELIVTLLPGIELTSKNKD